VRNTLLHTFNLVEGVVADSAQIGRVLQGLDPALPDPPAALPVQADAATAQESPVLGWQELVLNQNAVCDQCNAILPLGERAAIGVPVSARPRFLCLDCLASLAAGAGDPKPGKKPGRKSITAAGKN
jgi:hypothetical protein